VEGGKWKEKRGEGKVRFSVPNCSFHLVPELLLGTQFPAKLCCATEDLLTIDSPEILKQEL
jgi:hypothetical protein